MKSKELSIIRRIFALLRGINIHPKYLLVPLALSLLAATFEGASVSLLIPLLNGFLEQDFSFIKEAPYIGRVISQLPDYILASDRNLFGVLMGIFVVAVLLKNILRYCAIVAMRFVAVRSMHHLRKQMFDRYLSFGKLYFDSTSVGEHSTVLMQFPKSALRPVLVIDKYVNAFFSLLVYLVVMASISWKLTFFALPLFAILHFSVRTLIKSIEQYSHKLTERLRALSAKGVDILTNVSLVKSYSMEKKESKHYATISDEGAQVEFKTYRIQELIFPFQEILTLFSALLLFSGMLYLMVNESVSSASSFIVYFYLVLSCASKFGTLTGLRSAIASASGGVCEVEKILEDTKKFFVPSGKKEFEGLKEGIRFSNLSFSYPDGREVLHDVSFDIRKGSMTAIVGPTGTGKTTLINLLMRFYDCPPGSLLFDSEDVRSFTLKSLHTSMSLVSQETLLFHESLRHNITYGLENVSDEQLKDVLKRSRLADLIEQLPAKLETMIGDRGVKLSGGEKQRVSIARALLKDSDILILDEATSSLDSQTEKLIQEAIDEAVRGRTSVVIAHRLSTIKHAEKIVVLDQGKVIEQGTLEELLEKKGMFFMLWEQQRFV